MTFSVPFLNPVAPALPGRARRLATVLLLAVAVPAQAQFSDQVIEEAKASTVMILAVDGKGISGSGTGFFISDQGHVATNFHVVDGTSEWLVVFTSGDRVRMEKSTLVASSPENDLAILRTRKFAEARVMTLATAKPSSAQKVMAMGFPGALEIPSTSPGLEDHPDGDLQGSRGAVAPFVPATFSGEVGRFQEEAELPIAGGTSVKADMIAHSAKISGGNSGGPLIDVEGRAAGIIFALGSDDSGTVPYAYAIHSSHLVDLARRHRVPFRSSAARATPPGGGSALQTLLIVAFGALAVVSFLVTLKKPREAIVGGISRLTSPTRHARPDTAAEIAGAPQGSSRAGSPGPLLVRRPYGPARAQPGRPILSCGVRTRRFPQRQG